METRLRMHLVEQWDFLRRDRQRARLDRHHRISDSRFIYESRRDVISKLLGMRVQRDSDAAFVATRMTTPDSRARCSTTNLMSASRDECLSTMRDSMSRRTASVATSDSAASQEAGFERSTNTYNWGTCAIGAIAAPTASDDFEYRVDFEDFDFDSTLVLLRFAIARAFQEDGFVELDDDAIFEEDDEEDVDVLERHMRHLLTSWRH